MKLVASALFCGLSASLVSASWTGGLFDKNLKRAVLKPRASPQPPPPVTEYSLDFPMNAEYTKCPASYTRISTVIFYYPNGTATTNCRYLNDNQQFLDCAYDTHTGKLLTDDSGLIQNCPFESFPVGPQDSRCATKCTNTEFPLDYGVVDRGQDKTLCFFTVPRGPRADLQVGCFYDSNTGAPDETLNADTQECAYNSVSLGRCVDGPYSV